MLLLEMGSSDSCPPFRGSGTIHWAGTQRLLSPAEAHIQDAAAPAGWTSPGHQDKKETQPESHAAPSSLQLTWSVLPGPGRAAGGMCDFWHQKSGALLIYLDVVPPLGGSPKVSVAFFPLRIFPSLHSLPSPLQATPKNPLIKVLL